MTVSKWSDWFVRGGDESTYSALGQFGQVLGSSKGSSQDGESSESGVMHYGNV